MIIKTPEDYWNLVDNIWPSIIQIFVNVGAPLNQNVDLWGNEASTSMIAQLETLKRDRNSDIAIWFNHVWGAAPDSPHIHSWDHWGSFCDLCSETWVFEDEEDEKEEE